LLLQHQFHQRGISGGELVQAAAVEVDLVDPVAAVAGIARRGFCL